MSTFKVLCCRLRPKLSRPARQEDFPLRSNTNFDFWGFNATCSCRPFFAARPHPLSVLGCCWALLAPGREAGSVASLPPQAAAVLALFLATEGCACNNHASDDVHVHTPRSQAATSIMLRQATATRACSRNTLRLANWPIANANTLPNPWQGNCLARKGVQTWHCMRTCGATQAPRNTHAVASQRIQAHNTCGKNSTTRTTRMFLVLRASKQLVLDSTTCFKGRRNALEGASHLNHHSLCN